MLLKDFIDKNSAEEEFSVIQLTLNWIAQMPSLPEREKRPFRAMKPFLGRKMF